MSVEGGVAWPREGVARAVPTKVTAMIRSRTCIGSLHLEEHGTLLDGCPGLDEHAPDGARGRGAEFILHLHRLHHDEPLTGLHGIAVADVHPNDHPWHRRDERRWAGGAARRGREIADCARSLVECLDLEPNSIHPERVSAAGRAAPGDHPVHFVAEHEHALGGALELLDPSTGRDLSHGHMLPVDDNLELGAIDDHQVFHAAAGTSSHTVSTCAVCGNMSKATREAIA